VATDIEEFPKFKQMLGMEGPGVAGAGDGAKTVVMRDDPNGRYILVKIGMTQKFVDDHGNMKGVWDLLQARDFSLDDGAECVLFFKGFEELGDPNNQSVKIGEARITKKGTEFEVEGDSGGYYFDEYGIERRDLEDRLDDVRPNTLVDNVWKGALQIQQEEGFGDVSVVLLFPRPKSNTAKLVAFNNAEQAVPVYR
jgi:hypothetical protein